MAEGGVRSTPKSKILKNPKICEFHKWTHQTELKNNAEFEFNNDETHKKRNDIEIKKIVKNHLKKFQNVGVAQSKPITPENVGRTIRKPVKNHSEKCPRWSK